MSMTALTAQTPLPAPLHRFVSVMAIPGGLVLPGLLHIQVKLTPLAAAGLVIIMTMGVAPAALPFVAYGRWRVAPRLAKTSR
jgi:hypothetical protein